MKSKYLLMVFFLSIGLILINCTPKKQTTEVVTPREEVKTVKEKDSPEKHFKQGVALMERGELDKAIEEFTIAIKLNPDYAEAMMMLGDIYYEKKDKENAILWYKQALEKEKYLKKDQIEKIYRRLEELK